MFSRVTTIVLSLLILLNICSKVLGKCPPPEDISPCKCFESPSTVLECRSIHDDAVIKNVFRNSKNYKYVQVHFYYTTLTNLPHEMFTHTEVQELYFENSTLVQLFDSPPEELSMLYKVHLENTNIVNLSNWNLFKPLTSLKILTIYFNIIKTLDTSMDKFVTTNLEQLSLYSTETTKIEPGALTEFVNLDKLAIDACKLGTLSRDLFPNPFNARYLYFNDNELDSIPEDLFTNMPRLQTVGMKKNFLTTIPESAFGGITSKMSYLMLDENPIRCDCKLLWLIKSKPQVLSGTCATPIRLHDKQLRDISADNFKC